MENNKNITIKLIMDLEDDKDLKEFIKSEIILTTKQK